MAVSGHFACGDGPEDRDPLERWELAIEAQEQEKLHCLASRCCDSRKSQVECGRMVAREKNIEGSRDLVNYQLREDH
jgi:hypothetical protein